MMKQLGFGTCHAPGPTFEDFLTTRHDINVLADTPCFQPSMVQSILDRSNETKFIYIDKTAKAWIESMFKVGLDKAYASNYKLVHNGSASPYNQMDYDAMAEIMNGGDFTESTAREAFFKHKKMIESIIPQDRLLVYNFNQGWEALCKFAGKGIPDIDIPHLNKDTMFDQIV